MGRKVAFRLRQTPVTSALVSSVPPPIDVGIGSSSAWPSSARVFLPPIADIRALNVAQADQCGHLLRRIALRDLMRDRLFAIFQLALLVLPAALSVAGPDLQVLSRRARVADRAGSVSFRRLQRCRYVGPEQQWAQAV
jgi:hypothetical protein